jgi:hypothetical protein
VRGFFSLFVFVRFVRVEENYFGNIFSMMRMVLI